jgi:hypothetical protein
MTPVLGFFEHAPVEGEPGEFAIDESFRRGRIDRKLAAVRRDGFRTFRRLRGLGALYSYFCL